MATVTAATCSVPLVSRTRNVCFGSPNGRLPVINASVAKAALPTIAAALPSVKEKTAAGN
jgi:hypothetical protein